MGNSSPQNHVQPVSNNIYDDSEVRDVTEFDKEYTRILEHWADDIHRHTERKREEQRRWGTLLMPAVQVTPRELYFAERPNPLRYVPQQFRSLDPEPLIIRTAPVAPPPYEELPPPPYEESDELPPPSYAESERL